MNYVTRVVQRFDQFASFYSIAISITLVMIELWSKHTYTCTHTHGGWMRGWEWISPYNDATCAPLITLYRMRFLSIHLMNYNYIIP